MGLRYAINFNINTPESRIEEGAKKQGSGGGRIRQSAWGGGGTMNGVG